MKNFISRFTVNLNKYQLFTLFVLFFIGLGWLGLFLALTGIFYDVILTVYILSGAVMLLYLIAFNKNRIEINHRFFLIFLLTLVAIFVFAFYTTPTVFSGRDQGSLSETAIQLSQNHRLEFSFDASRAFFHIYGPGKALNFPGFSYMQNGNLITQFPIGYSAWLAIFYSIFSLNGFAIANGITFFIFLFSFYLTARYYLRSSSAVMAFLLVITSFIFSWFFKFTLSENLALALTWFGIYEFVLFTRRKERFYLLASFLSFGLLVFARPEALAFLAIIVAILLIRYKDWKYLLFAVIGKEILAVIGGMILLYIFNITVDSRFYIVFLKDLVLPFLSYKNDVVSSSGGMLASTYYILRVFSAYGLLNFLVFGIVGFVYLFKHKKFEILVPFLIVLPTFAYIVYPGISSDHPWMLRRFLFAVVPVSILYTVWFLDLFFKKRGYFYIFSSLLLLANLLVFVPYLAFSSNQNLLPQIKTISSNFSSTDLVLVDSKATGDGWSMMTGPMNFLFGKQAVYFFNPNDLAKIDRSKFSNIYFIIPNDDLETYRQSGLLARLVPVKNYQIATTALEATPTEPQQAFASPVKLPAMENLAVYGKIYMLKQ